MSESEIDRIARLERELASLQGIIGDLQAQNIANTAAFAALLAHFARIDHGLGDSIRADAIRSIDGIHGGDPNDGNWQHYLADLRRVAKEKLAALIPQIVRLSS